MTDLSTAEMANAQLALHLKEEAVYLDIHGRHGMANCLRLAAQRLEARREISEALNGLVATRVTVGDFMWTRDIKRPWTQCPSTHCERASECRSPHECNAKSRVNRFGLALMMIREGCAEPRDVARAALEASQKGDTP